MRLACFGAVGMLALALNPAFAQAEPSETNQDFMVLEAGVPLELLPGEVVGDALGQYRFTLEFAPTQNNELALIKNMLERTGVFASVLDELSDQIALPETVPVIFQECGEPNAYWSRNDHTVTMCYELAAQFFDDYSTLDNKFAPIFPWADHRQVTIGSTLFVLLHEIGHGMVTLFDLPITGREEDVVDQFAIFIVTNSDEEDQALAERPSRLALLAAYGMMRTELPMERAPRHYWGDEHSLAQQRGMDMLCMVFGSDPDAYSLPVMPGFTMIADYAEQNPDAFTGPALVEALNRADDLNLIPWMRARLCPMDYAKYEASWDYLIETFMTPKSN
ncbi:hypothetical protein JHC09_10230 [Devosia sp. MC532]|uniref:DUF4344 domain-containing metallopeptidase n=1 Tax=Devosia sp. MC532 TaxID=2799788 RepID=UPI0018F5AF31|nr:DUF4344 domain-containing metallopeptidase [Devosia sp. MC532]MBJ7578260.1 hypothetical protein [Devosia sp. MC532]